MQGRVAIHMQKLSEEEQQAKDSKKKLSPLASSSKGKNPTEVNKVSSESNTQ